MTYPKFPAVYIRVSKTIQKSRPAQLEECKLWMQRNGWPFDESRVYSEAESTLKNDVRPEYNRCRQDLKSGHIDGLIVWSMSRWARTFEQLIRDLGWFHRAAVPFSTVSENIRLATASDRFHARIIASFSAFERDVLSERISMGIRRSRAEGVKDGRPRGVEPARIVQYMLHERNPDGSKHSWAQCREKYDTSDASIGRALSAERKRLRAAVSKPLGRPALHLQEIEEEEPELLGD